MSAPIWLEHALKDVGTTEVRGGENPRIIEMHSHCTLHAREDEIPWCSAAICCWLEECGLPSTKSAAAISWATYGVKLETPRPGCICVIRQKRKGCDAATDSSSRNHVALWLAQDADRVWLLGGNQSDQVKKSSFGLGAYEVVAYRWPVGVL